MVDQTFILCLLDQAVEKTNRCSFLQVIATLGPFDQRDPDILQLGDLVVPGSVESASVHLASKVQAVREDTHHLLSRYGMLLLIGVRGSLFSTLGMHETCNFQSNLNNQHMDVGQAIMSVLSKSGTVTFVQLYADVFNSTHPLQPAFQTPRQSGSGHLWLEPPKLHEYPYQQGTHFPEVHPGLEPGCVGMPHPRLHSRWHQFLPSLQVHRPPEYQKDLVEFRGLDTGEPW